MNTTDIARSIALDIIKCFEKGNKVIIFGNGGSNADSSHFAGEFHSLGTVISLNDPAKITAIGNDIGFEFVFAIQVAATAKKGDLVIGLSSSGKSQNVILGLKIAKENGIQTIDFPRKGKGTQQVQTYQYKLLHQIYLIVRNYYEDQKH